IETARPGAEHQHIRLMRHRPCPARAGLVRDPGRSGRMRLAANRDRLRELRHAGALVREPVDLDEAFLADAHPAKEPARRAAGGLSERLLAGGDESGGHGLAGPRREGPAVERDAQAVGPELGAAEAQVAGHLTLARTAARTGD